MSLLIDGYNVLHAAHVLPDRWSEIGAVGLCRLIDRAGVKGRGRVVCDGAPPPKMSLGMPDSAQRVSRFEIGAVELIYAGGGKDADSLIEELIEHEPAPRDLFVISNDRRVQAAGKRRGATPVRSEEFLQRLSRALRARWAPSTLKPSSEPDPESWIRAFGLHEEPASPDQIATEADYWLREFGFEDQD